MFFRCSEAFKLPKGFVPQSTAASQHALQHILMLNILLHLVLCDGVICLDKQICSFWWRSLCGKTHGPLCSEFEGNIMLVCYKWQKILYLTLNLMAEQLFLILAAFWGPVLIVGDSQTREGCVLYGPVFTHQFLMLKHCDYYKCCWTTFV